ncbi:MAG: DedA family protein, partial [Alphaproteobacteria bacterium]
MLKRSYDWCVSFASHPSAPWLLFALTFIESSFSPLPPLPLLIPMCIARPDRAWFYAAICALGSVLGGYLGYAIGALLYDSLGLWLISLYGLQAKASELIHTSQHFWFWVLVTKGLTPIPFKIVTIMSGFLHFDLWRFTLGMIISRVTFFMM